MPKNITVLSIIVALALGATLGYYVGYDHGWETSANLQITPPPPASNNDESPMENEEPVFHKDANGNFYGTLTLTGYLDVQKRVCAPDAPCGSTVDYASFVFTETSSKAIKEFTGTNAGNSFIAGDRVGIGCQQKDLNRIFYENFADKDKVTGEIKGNDYTKLIASSKNNQIELKLTRELYTSGQGAPDCYSHFRNLDVL